MAKNSDYILGRIPDASLIRERMREVQVELKKLKYLLKVAERLESQSQDLKEVTHG